MDWHGVLSVVACAGHLAFAVLVWLRRGKSPIARWLALLFVDAFGWNFADLAHRLTGGSEWHVIDRTCSSFMAAIALHVVVVFVGKTKALRRVVGAAYLAALALAGLGLDLGGAAWILATLVGGNLAAAFAVWLLVEHRRQAEESAERARSTLILVALVVGAASSSTDLWSGEVRLGFWVPQLGNVGTLLAMVLFAIATLRLRLLETAIPAMLLAYALSFAVLCVTAYLLAVRWLERPTALIVLSALTLGVIALAVARELGGAAALARERVRRLTTLGRFSEQLAHDLRNPLAALKGALQFLTTERAEGRSLDAQSEFLGLMLEQVGRLERVVGNYQRLAKVEPALTPGSVNDVVREVLGMQRLAVSGITLRADLAVELPSLALDKDLLATTLENVLRNAYESMPDGGTVTVRTEPLAGGVGVALSVEDEGCGMDARELERASDELYTTKVTGTGLGLSFARRVARAHGGTLSLTSRPGKGTVVRLSLPLGG